MNSSQEADDVQIGLSEQDIFHVVEIVGYQQQKFIIWFLEIAIEIICMFWHLFIFCKINNTRWVTNKKDMMPSLMRKTDSVLEKKY